MFDSDCLYDILNLEHRSRLTFCGKSCSRVILMSGHTCDAVIQNDVNRITVVVNRIHQ